MKSGQQLLAVNTLYSTDTTVLAPVPNLEVRGGVVNVWGSHEKPASPPTNMSKSASGTSFSGIDAVGIIMNYMYFEAVSGTPIIISTGIKATTPAV